MGPGPLLIATVVLASIGAVAGGAAHRLVLRHTPEIAPARSPASPPLSRAAPPRAPLAIATAGLFAGCGVLVLSAGHSPAVFLVLAALLVFAALSLTLAVIDLRIHRLPDALVLPAYPTGLGLFSAAALAGARPDRLWGALLGALALFGLLFLVRAVQPGAMGGGDVKLAGVLGLHLGWFGIDAVVVGLLAAFLLGGAYGLVLLITGRADRRTAIAFGPWLIAGAWTGIAVGILTGGVV